MKKRLFGKKQIPVSEIGLGSWQIGAGWGQVEDTTAREILEKARNQGITFFDTADVYGDGRSEKLIGAFFEQKPREVFIATKLGRTPDLYPNGYTKSKVREHITQSLQRLGTDNLDLIQTHCVPRQVMEEGAIYEWLSDFKQEGLIRNFGASVETMEEAMICMRHPEMYSLQIIFNIFRQSPNEEVLNKARENNTGIIVRVPLASGLLSGKFTSQSSFAEDDHRRFNRDGSHFNIGETFAGIPFEKGVEMANELKKQVPDGFTLSQMALRWILDHEAVSVVIPGASKPQQVEMNAAASELPPLSPELHRKLRSYYDEFIEGHIQGHY